jgi:hypothetical protein
MRVLFDLSVINFLEVDAMSDSDGSRGDRTCFGSIVCRDSLESEPRLRTARSVCGVNLITIVPVV